MALAGALCSVVHAVTGFTNKSLRGLVAGLLGTDYSANQMSYDLRRLRLHGLIERIPHTNTYVLTPDGIRVAVFYTKVHDRLLRPLLAGRPTARTHRAPPRPGHHRPHHRRLRHQRPPRSRRLKLVTTRCKTLAVAPRYASCRSKFAPGSSRRPSGWRAKRPACARTGSSVGQGQPPKPVAR